MRRALGALICGAVLGFVTNAAQAEAFAHFEARQVHPIALTPDLTRLLALNSTDGRLSVFDISNEANAEPVLLAEVPVGLEPVSVRARTNDEVWVVNEVSDSVSVVLLSRATVIDTLRAVDEPADVLFAGSKAFVTCARNNLVRVFDATTRDELATIPLQGLYPRALAASADGARIYAAFLHSGNGTTVLPAAEAPAQPAPTNPDLPAAPDTALIVPANTAGIPYTVLDHDVAEIDAATYAIVRYFGGAGTTLFDIAVQPATGDLWVPNTEARNLVRFEPTLRGHVVDHRLTRLLVSDGTATIHDLNPDVDYGELPNPGALATALAQPTAAVFAPDGSRLWVAAFGSDRVRRAGHRRRRRGRWLGLRHLRSTRRGLLRAHRRRGLRRGCGRSGALRDLRHRHHLHRHAGAHQRRAPRWWSGVARRPAPPQALWRRVRKSDERPFLPWVPPRTGAAAGSRVGECRSDTFSSRASLEMVGEPEVVP